MVGADGHGSLVRRLVAWDHPDARYADYGLWHGWVIGYNAADLRQRAGLFNTTPNGNGGSVWQSGRGLAADETGAWA